MMHTTATSFNAPAFARESFLVEAAGAPFTYAPLQRVLTGKRAVCQLRGLFSPEVCKKISANFWSNPGLQRRPDSVPGYYVGAYHYAKSTADYLQECEATRAHVDALFHDTENPLQTLECLLREAVASMGGGLRRAQHAGRLAGLCGATSWAAPGEYMLAPHDDVAQVGTPEQRGFEIQDVRKQVVVGVNLYVSMPSQGGELELWNVRPTEQWRQALGIQHRGHPYPVDGLRSYDSQVLTLRPGDCVLLNGAFVHGVRGAQADLTNLNERRLILTFFVGLKSNGEAIWWT